RRTHIIAVIVQPAAQLVHLFPAADEETNVEGVRVPVQRRCTPFHEGQDHTLIGFRVGEACHACVSSLLGHTEVLLKKYGCARDWCALDHHIFPVDLYMLPLREKVVIWNAPFIVPPRRFSDPPRIPRPGSGPLMWRQAPSDGGACARALAEFHNVPR